VVIPSCPSFKKEKVMAVKKAEAPLHIEAAKQGRVKFVLLGQTPLYYNAMSAKAKRSLLIGGGKKTAAEKKNIKHNPEEEFNDSVYRMITGETLLGFPAPAVKGAMATAALETAGITKTSVQRLIFLPEQKIKVWGKPQLKMDVVRSADMNRTPDVRTRAFLPEWCAEVDIAFVSPTLSMHSILALLINAGMLVGIGDFRQEKGRGSYGTFTVHPDGGGDMADRIDEIKKQGRMVQTHAMEVPEMADAETEELYNMLQEERVKRAA